MSGLAPRKVQPFVYVKGHELSRTSVSLRFGHLPLMVGWTAINFETVRTPGIAHATAGLAAAVTRGKITCSADLTVYEREWSQIRSMLTDLAKEQGKRSWMEAMVASVVLSYFEPSTDLGVQTVELTGCQVLSVKQGISDSDDQLTRTLNLFVVDILEGGISEVDIDLAIDQAT